MTKHDEELITTLMAISVVSKRLAGNMLRLAELKKGEENGKHRRRNQKMRRYPKRYR